MKSTILELSRWLFAAAAVIFIGTSVLDSGGGSDASLEEVESAVTAVLDMQTMQAADNQMIRRLYALDPAEYEGIVLYYPTTNMGAEELLIVKLADTAQQAAVADAVQARLETQKNSFEGYGIEQYDLLTNNSVLEVQGNFILFVVNPASSDAVTAFLDAL